MENNDRLLTGAEVRQMVGIKNTLTLRRMADRGAFPVPVKLGFNLRWRESEVQRYMASLERAAS